MIIYEDKTVLELNVNSSKIKVMARPSDLLLDTLRTQARINWSKARMQKRRLWRMHSYYGRISC